MFRRPALLALGLVLAVLAAGPGWTGGKSSSKAQQPAGQDPVMSEPAGKPTPAATKSGTEPAGSSTAPATSPAGGPAAEEASDSPIKILSDSLEADDQALTVTFRGEVKATQDETTLWCDVMVVHYTKENRESGLEDENADRKIRKIEVFGHVKVVKQDKTALGQQGFYDLENRLVELWGDPRLIQGDNVIDGDRVILYLDENRALVKGGPKKVEATLVPSKKKTPAEGDQKGGGS